MIPESPVRLLPTAVAALVLCLSGCKPEEKPAAGGAGGPSAPGATGGAAPARATRLQGGAGVAAEGTTEETVEGMQPLPSGVRYSVVRPGEGPSPPPGALVTIHCRGWSVDKARRRTEFLDTRSSGAPRQYVLSSNPQDARGQGLRRVEHLIPGLVEPLLAMKAGETRRLMIPPESAYGSQGLPPRIPPGAELIMEVELVSFTPPGSPAAK
jgi:peptidylprolyl isomerase